MLGYFTYIRHFLLIFVYLLCGVSPLPMPYGSLLSLHLYLHVDTHHRLLFLHLTLRRYIHAKDNCIYNAPTSTPKANIIKIRGQHQKTHKLVAE